MDKIKYIGIFLIVISIAKATNYYVSPNGTDGNPGTSPSQAWRTLVPVNAIQSSLQPGDQVLFERDGVYRGSITLNSSGNSLTNQITYGAYGTGAKPLFLGSQSIAGWVSIGGDKWTRNPGFAIEELFINDIRQIPARYPNKGYLTIESSSGTASITNGSLGAFVWTGAKIVVRRQNDYIPRGTVLSQSGNTIDVDVPGADQFPVGNGFYLDHSLNALDVSGEWYQDPATNLITIKMPLGVNPNTQTIEGSVLDYGIYSDYRNFIKISEIQFKNYKKNGISILSTRGSTIQNCAFRNILEKGVEFRGEWTNDIINTVSTRGIIDSCTFHDILSEAIYVAFMKDMTITRNYAKRIALIPGYEMDAMNEGFGFYANQGYITTISYNRIDSTGYSSLSWGGQANNIYRNEFSNHGLSKNDNGFLQTWGGDTKNNVVTENILHDGFGNEEGMANASTTYANGASTRGASEGIYFDDFTLNNTITGNTVYNSSKGIFVQSSRDFVIKDNTVYNCEAYGIFVNEKNLADPFTESAYGWSRAVSNINILNNKVYALRASPLNQNMCMTWSSYTCNSLIDFGVSDSNYFFNPYKNGVLLRNNGDCINGGTIEKNYSLSSWRTATSKDANSKTNSFRWNEYIISTTGVNLISNGTFDTNINNWNSYGSGTIVWENNASLTGGSLKASQTSGTAPAYEIQSPNIAVQPGKVYVVSFSAIANRNTYLNPVIVTKYPDFDYVFNAGNLISSTQKNDYLFVFTAPSPLLAGASYGLHFYTQTSGDIIWIDNVSILEVTSLQPDDYLNRSKLFVNNQINPQSFSLGGNTYTDLDGNTVTGSITLQPYRSKILILQSVSNQFLATNPSVLNVPSASSVQTITVSSNLAWSITGIPSWLTLSTISGIGNATLAFTFSTNTTTTGRSATVTVSGGTLTQLITVTQSGVAFTLSLAPNTMNFIALGGSIGSNITSNTNWNVSNTASWLTPSTLSGFGTTGWSVNAGVNTNTGARFAIITVSGGGIVQFVNITQTGAAASLVANPTSLTYPSTGSAQNIGITSNVTWTSTSSQPWLTLTGGSGTNNGTISATASINTATGIRIAQVTISGGAISQIVNITQTGAALALMANPVLLNYSSIGSTMMATITSNINWIINGVPSWITINTLNGVGNNVLSLIAQTNSNPINRSSILTISGMGINQFLQVFQSGSGTLLGTSLRSDGVALVNGVPFFPIGYYGEGFDVLNDNIYIVDKLSNGGFNTLYTEYDVLSNSEFNTFFDYSASKNIHNLINFYYPQSSFDASIQSFINTFKGKPSILAWGVCDDANSFQSSDVIRKNTLVKNADPTRISYQSFYDGGLKMDTTVGIVDASAMQSYPIYINGNIDRDWNRYREISVKTRNAGKLSLANLQVYRWDNNVSNRWPTANELEVQSYLALVAGIKGIIYYTFKDYDATSTVDITQSPLWNKSKQFASELNSELKDALLNGIHTCVGFGAAPTTYYGKWTYNNEELIIAINAKSVNSSISIPITKSTAKSVFASKNSTLSISSNFLQGVLGPMEVQVYRIYNPILSVNSNSFMFPSTGSLQVLSIISNMNWSISGLPTWIILNTTSGSSNSIINLTASNNTFTGIRVSQVSISGGSLTQIVNITQTGAAASLIANPLTLTYPSSGSAQSIGVTSNVAWTSTSSQPWLTLTNGSGTNNGTISATANANTATGIRIAQVTITGGAISQIVNITQTGAAANLVANPTTLTYPSGGSAQNIGITSNVSWTSTSSQTWLTLTGGSGTNNGTISAIASANTMTGIRIAQVTISGGALTQIVNITQTGAAASLVATPTTLNYPSAGSSQNIGITSNVSWSSTSSQPWLTLTNGSGTNNGTILATASINTATGIRIGQVTISGGSLTQIVNITQTGAAASLVATPTTLNYPSAGSSQNIGITSNVSWTSTSSQPWLTLTNGSGTNNGTISATAIINTATGIRIAQVTITGGSLTQIVNITQTGANPTVSVGSSTASFTSAGGTQIITINSNSAWNVTGIPSWMTVSATNGSGNGVITLTAPINGNVNANSGTLAITSGLVTAIINVNQNGSAANLVASPLILTYSSAGSAQNIGITSNVTWTSTSSQPWLTLTGGSGTNNGTISAIASANTMTGIRIAQVTISGGALTQIVNITQTGAAASLVATPTTLNYPSAGSSQNIGITSNVSWTSTSSQLWLTLTNGSGTNNGTISATASINTATGIRIAQVTITGGAISQIVNITQTGAAANLVANPTTLTYPSGGSAQNIGITSNVSWTSTSSQPWLTLTNGSGTNNGTISATASINTATGIRIAQVTISGGSLTQIVNVTQTGAAASLVASPTTLNYASSGSLQNIGITSNVTWTSTSSQPWLTLSGGTGSNDGTISATTSINTATGIRIAQVTISGGALTQIVNITQTGAVANLVATPTTLNYPSAGSSQNIGITSNVSWTSTSSQPWLTLTGGSGTNNGTISATASINTATGIRIAQVTISGGAISQIVNITQTGAAASLVANPLILTYSSAGSAQNIGITSNVTWTSTSSQPWLTLTNGSGTNNGTISATAIINTATGIRIAQVTITGGSLTQIVNITQTGANPTVSVGSSTASFTSAGGTQIITINSNSAWNVTGIPSWMTVSATNGSGNGVITLTAPINGNVNANSGTLAITSGLVTAIINVNQNGSAANLVASPLILTYSSAGSAQNIGITSNVTWTSTSSQPWLTLTGGSGTNNGTISASTSANTATGIRIAQVTISGGAISQIVNITQTGAAANLVANPTTLNYPSAGSSQNIGITSNVSWTSTSSQPWLTLTNGSGTNNGTISATISINTATGIRIAQVTITGGAISQIVNITQTGAAASLVASQTTLNYASGGSSQNISVTSNVSWTSTSSQPWLTLTNGSGTNNGTISATAIINTATGIRIAQVTITGGSLTQIVNITQTGANSTVNVGSNTASFSASGGTQIITINSNSTWNVTGIPVWMTVSPTSGSGNGVITLTAPINGNVYANTGILTITSGLVTTFINANQSGSAANLVASPSTLTYSASGSSQNIGITSNVTWTSTSSQPWLTLTGGSGTNNGTISATASANTATGIRTAQVTITGGSLTQIVNITQTGAAASLVANPTTLNYASSGSSQNISVTSNVTWTSTSSQPWLTLTGGSGTNNGTISVTAATNTATGIRTAHVTITGGSLTQIVNVTQTGAAASLVVNPTTLNYASSGNSQNISVTSNVTWTSASSQPWLTLSGGSGTNNGTISATAAANTATGIRIAQVTITGGSLTQIVNITQTGANPTVSVGSSTASFTSAGGIQIITINSNSTWNVTGIPSWMTVAPTTGNGNGVITLTAPMNGNVNANSGILTITSGLVTTFINANQSGSAANLVASPSTLTYSASGSSQNIGITSNVTWTSTSSQPWLTLTGGSGSNNGTISATASTNTATGIRTAQVTITGGALTQIVNITQTGANTTVSVGSSTASFTSSGGIQIITINSNSSWNVTGIPAWMTVSPASGSGNGVITLTAAANMSINQQNATLNVSSGSSSSTVNINQTGAAEYLNTDVASLSFGATGGSNLFSILSNVQWIVVEVPTWITISTTNGFGNANITLSLSENFLNINRTYQLTVSGINTNRVLTINQDAAPVVGSLSESIVSFVAMGGLKSIDVLAGSGWTVTSNNTAVSVSPTTGNGNGTFSITGLPNRQNIPILATVSVNFGTSVSYIYITIGATTAVYNKNQSDKIDLILSPNPAKSNSFIKFNKQISFRMFDILGNLHGKATNVSEFQIINLPSGVYFIQTNENEVRKLVVE